MKTLVVALCVLAAAASPARPPHPPRRARSLAHSHAHAQDYEYGTHHHYDEPHTHEYYTVGESAAPAHYELGARHVLTSARTRYHVQVPVTYSYTYESAPTTSVVSYQPAVHAPAASVVSYQPAVHAHAHAHAFSTHEHAHPGAAAHYSSPTQDWQWDPAWC